MTLAWLQLVLDVILFTLACAGCWLVWRRPKSPK